jgi:hypothetical protein
MPVLTSTSFSTNENIALSAQLTATDPAGGTVTFAQAGSPANGAITSFTAAGAFGYKPNANFTGNDSFPVTLTNTAGTKATGTVTITVRVNQPPVAGNYVVRADGTALNAINVLGQAKDPDADPLTVTIAQQPLVGTATVNADGTVQIASLPPGFKGLTVFKYQVTDPSAASATATAAVFVGADPFRALFAGDATGNGSEEVYLTDFAAAPIAVTTATQGNMRLRGFAASQNGATVLYHRTDITAPSTSDLWLVLTATPSQQVAVALPSGHVVAQDASGTDEMTVSPDGKWVAAVTNDANNAQALYLASATNAQAPVAVSPANAVYVSHPRFSTDSRNIYFLASVVAGGAVGKSLYTVTLASPGTTTLISAPNVANTDDVLDYTVAPDQSSIALEANRLGAVGLYYVNPAMLQTEWPVSAMLAAGQSIADSTVGLPYGSGSATHVAYTVKSTVTPPAFSVFAAGVSATPNPGVVATSAASMSTIGFRPDNAALLYIQNAQVQESAIGGTPGTQTIGVGANAWYDSTGNIVLLEQFLSTTPYPVLAVTARGQFGTTYPMGTTGMAAQYFSVSGFDRAVVLLGEGPPGPKPASAQFALINAMAGDKLLYLAPFKSPLTLASDPAQIVTY